MAALLIAVPGCRNEHDPPIDPAVFADTARDAVAPAAVIHPTATPAPTAAVPARKPNFIVILADDLGYGDLSSYGSRAISTPNLDQLAADGVRFTESYSSAPVCSPSRAGLMTGRYPLRTGITYVIFASNVTTKQRMKLTSVRVATRIGAGDFHDSWVSGIPASEITLPEALRVAGYATGMVGKWHLGDFSDDPSFLPTRHGFDFFEGIPHSNDEFPVSWWRGEKEISPNIGLDQEGVTDKLTHAAIEFIDANRQKPFFLYFAHKDVHLPLYPNERFRGKSKAGAYGDSVSEMDESVGQIVAALKERGLEKDTMILFTSDNGPWFEGSNEGLRGRKGTPFEGGQRVPMIAAWPGRIPGGRVVDAPTMNIDLFPTLLHLAGLGLPTDRTIDGADLGGLLDGSSSATPHDSLLFFHDKQLDGVRAGPLKYYPQVNRMDWPIPYDKPGSITGDSTGNYVYRDDKTGREANLLQAGPMLYDLGTDPFESYNLVEARKDDAQRLAGVANKWNADFEKNPRGWK